MAGLERNSHGLFRCAPPGRMRHAPCESLPRHCHREAFATVVLAGGYDEAGDTGRHRVRAGDVIFHRAFESHLDLFSSPGADVLVIPMPDLWAGPTLGSIDDPDAIVRTSERDPVEALELLLGEFSERAPEAHDWPDALAEALRADPSLSLEQWAEEAGMHPGSVSRGFARVFGMSAAAYRLVQRTRRAIDALVHTEIPLSQLAVDCAFADQAHMTRAVVMVAGAPPALLRHQYRRD
jgi:AraC-like DNA-binding protein